MAVSISCFHWPKKSGFQDGLVPLVPCLEHEMNDVVKKYIFCSCTVRKLIDQGQKNQHLQHITRLSFQTQSFCVVCGVCVRVAEQQVPSSAESRWYEVADELGPTGATGVAWGVCSQRRRCHDNWEILPTGRTQDQGCGFETLTFCCRLLSAMTLCFTTSWSPVLNA